MAVLSGESFPASFKSLRSWTRASCIRHSRRRLLGIRIMWHGRTPGLRSLKDSQRSLLALLRSTALRLNFLPQTTPHLSAESGAGAIIATISWEVSFLPFSRTCAKSDFKFSLSPWPRVSFNAGIPSFSGP